jgi:hypothetical protein
MEQLEVVALRDQSVRGVEGVSKPSIDIEPVRPHLEQRSPFKGVRSFESVDLPLAAATIKQIPLGRPRHTRLEMQN